MRTGVLCAVLTMLGACGPDTRRWSELTPQEQEQITAEAEARRAAALASGELETRKQTITVAQCPFFLPEAWCGSDVQTTTVMECAAWYPSSYQVCDDLACSWGTYEQLPPAPITGMARYWFGGGQSLQFSHGANQPGVCFEIDSYVGSGKLGIPHLGSVASPNGELFYANDSSQVHLRTGTHVTSAVYVDENYAHPQGSGVASLGPSGAGWAAAGGAGWITSVAVWRE